MVIRRFFLLLAAFILFFNAASAGIEWPDETTGEKVLKQYIESVNRIAVLDCGCKSTAIF